MLCWWVVCQTHAFKKRKKLRFILYIPLYRVLRSIPLLVGDKLLFHNNWSVQGRCLCAGKFFVKYRFHSTETVGNY